MSLERLRGGLIVSVQAESTSLLNTPETIALLARVAAQNGAAGVRIEGEERIRAVRAALALPIIGIIKRSYPGYEPYITPSEREVRAIAAAGADIIAFDATPRGRPAAATVESIVGAIHRAGALAMADCAQASDAQAAAATGAEIVGTTLCGYTSETRGARLPALDLVRTLAAFRRFTICEGGVGTADDVKFAFAAGADAVVVGTAITNVDVLVRRFVDAATPPT